MFRAVVVVVVVGGPTAWEKRTYLEEDLVEAAAVKVEACTQKKHTYIYTFQCTHTY